MTIMRDRLIELIKRDNCRNPFTCSPQCKYVESDDCHSERLADLILADGWIRPPCKVGDIIYRIVNGKIKESEVEKIEITKNMPAIFYDWHGMGYELSTVFDFGKTVFFTKEEAEAKLQEEKG